jgi:hypothetical protein
LGTPSPLKKINKVVETLQIIMNLLGINNFRKNSRKNTKNAFADNYELPSNQQHPKKITSKTQKLSLQIIMNLSGIIAP